MSLDWKMPEDCDKSLLTYEYTQDNGEKKKQMHPKLHTLIWMSMAIKRNYCGGEKQKSDVYSRIAYMNYRYPQFALSIHLGGEVQDLDTVWKGAVKSGDGYKYYIQPHDIEAYWGLWTNADDKRETFAQFCKSLERMNMRYKQEG